MVTWTGDMGVILRKDGARYWDVVRLGVVADLVVGGRRGNQGSFVSGLRLVMFSLFLLFAGTGRRRQIDVVLTCAWMEKDWNWFISGRCLGMAWTPGDGRCLGMAWRLGDG
jgi:hypothetical protein